MVIYANLILKLNPSNARTVLNMTRSSLLNDPRQKQFTDLNEKLC